MSNSWKKWGHGKKSIFKRLSEKIEFHVPPAEIVWKFFINERPNPTFEAVFEKEPEVETKLPALIHVNKPIQVENNNKEIMTSPVTLPVPKTIEMVEVQKKELAIIIPKPVVKRKEVYIPWFPVVSLKRKNWIVPLPKIKWRMPLLKKLALSSVIVVFPMLLFAAAFLIYQVKDMYDNGFVKDVIQYKLDEKLKNSEDRMQSQINDLKTKTDELDAYKQTIYQIKWIPKYRTVDVKGRRKNIN